MKPSPDSDPFGLPLRPAACGLIGAGGHARVVASAMRRLGLVLAAVFDADAERIGTRFCDVIIEPEPGIAGRPGLALHLAIGSNALRRRLATAYPAARWLTLVDPGAQVADDVTIDDGAFVNMGARLQTGVNLGRHVLVNTGAIIDHDSQVGAFAHVAPGAVVCGGVTIGSDVLVGAGAVVLPGIRVGAGAVIGAGAVVTRDVSPGDRVAGAPARATSSRAEATFS
ncbi:acetyltransferase [soil metagenome]